MAIERHRMQVGVTTCPPVTLPVQVTRSRDMITNSQSGTNVHEVADGIYRINTPVGPPGGVAQFNFNQYLVVDDAPLLFHAGLRQMFPLLREAIAAIMPVEKLAYVGFSHFESDECGALNL